MSRGDRRKPRSFLFQSFYEREGKVNKAASTLITNELSIDFEFCRIVDYIVKWWNAELRLIRLGSERKL